MKKLIAFLWFRITILFISLFGGLLSIVISVLAVITNGIIFLIILVLNLIALFVTRNAHAVIHKQIYRLINFRNEKTNTTNEPSAN